MDLIQEKLEESVRGGLLQSFPSNLVSSSKKPDFSLIPYGALVELSERFELGKLNHKEKAWNALSPNQAGLDDEDWIDARVSHVIHHAYMFLLKRRGIIPDDGDNDAAAIMWAGCMFSEARRRKAGKDREPRKGEKDAK